VTLPRTGIDDRATTVDHPDASNIQIQEPARTAERLQELVGRFQLV
jgi:hypothetical protein